MNTRLKLAPSVTKSAEENKNALPCREKWASRATKLMLWGRMPITCNMNSANLERKRQRTRTRLIDYVMPSLSRSGSAKTMMPRSRQLIMTFIKLRRDLMSLISWLTLRSSNSEELMKHLTLPILKWLDARMTIQDLWLRPKPFRETLTDNSPTNLTCRDKPRMRTIETETWTDKYSKERRNSGTQKIS